MLGRPHARFIAAVRRRQAAARATDAAGVWTAVAAVAVAVTLPLAEWAGLRPAVAVVPCALAAVLVSGVRLAGRWPTSASAAAVADRHFGWDDLLATANATPATADPFASAVATAADARCAGRRASDVPVTRLGPAAWSLVIATVLGCALLATATAGPASPATADGAARADAAALTADPDAQPRPADVARRTGSDPTDGRSPGLPDRTPSKASDGSEPAAHAAAAIGSGRGTGSSPPDDRPEPPAVAAVDPPAPTVAGVTPAGGGTASAAPVGSDVPVGATATVRPFAVVRSNRLMDVNPAGPAAAAALAARSVPAPDRDLVRAYFDPTVDAK